MSSVIKLLPGREKSLLRRHPWIFSGAIQSVSGKPIAGEVVSVVSNRGEFLAWASFSPVSQLRARVWSFNEKEVIDADFFRRRVAVATELRKKQNLQTLDGGCRIIYSESDGLPGVIADRYADVVVVQFLSAGAEFFRELICDAIEAQYHPRAIFERSDASIRKKEGLEERSGQLRGAPCGDMVRIIEDGYEYEVDLRNGQKTGFYFDLRLARRILREFAAEKNILNAFSYTGAFAVTALKVGAKSVLNLDSSAPALQQAKRNIALNFGDSDRAEYHRCDVFEELRALKAQNRKFDLVILDPPKLVSCKGDLLRGCRAYQDLARLGFQLLERGGMLFNFSCSGLVDIELFQKITAAAALEAGVDATIIRRVDQSGDHPIALNVPETRYLKGLVSVVN